MISAMTKYQFLVFHKQYDDFLLQLRDMGMVHVVQRQAGEVDPASHLAVQLQDLARIESIEKDLIQTLQGCHGDCAPPKAIENLGVLIEQYDQLQKQKSNMLQKSTLLEKEILQMSIWGDFSWQTVEQLRDAGYIMRFFSVSQRNYNPQWENDFNAMVIKEDGVQVFFITLTPSGVEVLMDDVERVQLPERSLGQLVKDQQVMSSTLDDLTQEIYQFAKDNYLNFEQALRQAQEAIDYTKVKLSTVDAVEDKVLLLEGWVPSEEKQKMNAFLDQEGVVYTAVDATKNDIAPTKLSNNRFARLFHPITELYDMPSFGEVDLTPFFAPFFVLFFGLCLGDAGYGLLLFIAGLIARKKKPAMKSYMTLIAIFGLGTMFCGVISGTFFGIPLLEVEWPWIQKFKVIMFDSNELFNLALIIGVVQIIFGMFIKAISQSIRFGLKNVLASWGWILIIVGCGGAYALQSQGMIEESVSKWIMYIAGGIGAVFVFLLNDLHRNPLLNIGAGIWDTYNMATGLLGDVLSYVRLFALGISGSILGLVFNDLSQQMSPDIPVIGFLVSALILVFGHSMNIFMSGLGAFVHPMRLTFVEFYKNAGFEGGGTKYNPFARIKKQD